MTAQTIASKGTFFNHDGFARAMMFEEFGRSYRQFEEPEELYMPNPGKRLPSYRPHAEPGPIIRRHWPIVKIDHGGTLHLPGGRA